MGRSGGIFALLLFVASATSMAAPQPAIIVNPSQPFKSSSILKSTPPAKVFSDAYRDGYVWTLWRTDYSDNELNAKLDRIKQSGAQALQIPVFGCQSTLYSADIDHCGDGKKEFAYKMADFAAKKGFATSFLPMMGAKTGGWRGYIAPSDVNEWFKNYTLWIVDVAREASKRGMTELVAASEYNNLMRYHAQWRSVISEIRQVFSGAVVYTANWDVYQDGPWDAVDAIGVSAYFPVSTAKNPSQKELDQGWLKLKNDLLSLSVRWNRPVHITEVGYVNAEWAAMRPYYTSPFDPVDDALQARAFQAFANVWRGEKKLVRAFVWKTGLHGLHVSVDADPLDRPAEFVLKTFFTDRSLLRP
jgi:hypothetical protein